LPGEKGLISLDLPGEKGLMFRNVLVYADGSPSGDRALRQAIEIASASGGRIGILGVASRPSPMISTAPFTIPVSRTALAAELESEARRHVDEAERAVPADVPVTKMLAHGSSAKALLAHAGRCPWDLLVVGQRAASERWPSGRRLGARLSRSSPVPVLIVRDEADAAAEDRAPRPAARAQPAAAAGSAAPAAQVTPTDDRGVPPAAPV
jgi:nucleotide-binding universal stress UspA family protein